VKPYYEQDGITIYHGDCQDIMGHLNVQVMVTDPPYGMDYTSGWSGATVAGDNTRSVRNEVLARWGTRPALIFGRWNIARPRGTRACLIWDKGEWPGMGDLTFPWGPSHEEIYVLGKGWHGTREGTVLRCNRLGGNGEHPTEKPVALLERLLRHAPGGVILDPFMGSGTTLLAAKNLSRRGAIGIEIEERYCEIAARRLDQTVLDLA
jgi:DNA modification methylase